MTLSSEIKEQSVSPVHHVIPLFALTDSNLTEGIDPQSLHHTLLLSPTQPHMTILFCNPPGRRPFTAVGKGTARPGGGHSIFFTNS